MNDYLIPLDIITVCYNINIPQDKKRVDNYVIP